MRHLKVPVGVRTAEAMHEHDRRLAIASHDVNERHLLPPERCLRWTSSTAGPRRSERDRRKIGGETQKDPPRRLISSFGPERVMP